MGSQHNSEACSENSKKSHNPGNQLNDLAALSSALLTENISYKGIKSETTSANPDTQSGCSSISERTDNQSEKSEDKYPFLFEWKEGGESVFITGSFCGWESQFLMTRNPISHNFELLLYLPLGRYEFKFIVDGEWKCSTFIPIICDQNSNKNNYLEIYQQNPKATTNNNTNTIIENNKLTNYENHYHKTSKKKHVVGSAIQNNGNAKRDLQYNTNYPCKSDFNLEAPNIPLVYLSLINYNFKQTPILPGKSSSFFDKNLLNVNNSYKSIQIPVHANLNHILMNCKRFRCFYTLNITFRVKKKFTSIIYCQPYSKE